MTIPPKGKSSGDRAEAIRQAQELVRKHGRPGVSLADELIADPRAEAGAHRKARISQNVGPAAP